MLMKNIQLLFGECLDKLTEIPDGSVNMIMADLPYGTTACKWDSIIPLEPLWKELKRVTKENAILKQPARGNFPGAMIRAGKRSARQICTIQCGLATICFEGQKQNRH